MTNPNLTLDLLWLFVKTVYVEGCRCHERDHQDHWDCASCTALTLLSKHKPKYLEANTDEDKTIKERLMEARQNNRIQPKDQLAIIEKFVSGVERRAEATMAEGHKLEGAHYAAMMAELKEMRKRIEISSPKTGNTSNDLELPSSQEKI